MKNYVAFLCALMLWIAMPDVVEKNNCTEIKENWWCMLYPNEQLKSSDVEIKLKVVEIFAEK